MSKSTPSDIHPDDHAVIEAGYRPQLKRSLGFFSSFAVSFSFMSILMGISANYGFVLDKAGPFGIWSWVLVGAGRLMVTLVFAELAASMPLTGAVYNWNRRMVNPQIGWLSAWLLFFAYTIGVTGVIAAFFIPLQSLLGMQFDAQTIAILGVGLIVLQMLINIYSVRLAAYTNKLAVIAEIIALTLFGAALLAVIIIKGEVHVEFLTQIPATTDGSYWESFLMASLMAAWTIFGFEISADLSEETTNVRRNLPKSLITSVISVIVLGFAFLTIITLAIQNLPEVAAAADPVFAIVNSHLGGSAAAVFVCFVLIGMFACSLVGMTAASRLVFAVARDGGMIGAKQLTQVSAHGIPVWATVVAAAVILITFLSFQNVAALYASPVVLLYIVYLTTVVSFAFGAHKMPKTGHFSLGRFRWPVTILAILLLVGEICIMTIPAEFNDAAYVALGVVITGLVICGFKNLSRAQPTA